MSRHRLSGQDRMDLRHEQPGMTQGARGKRVTEQPGSALSSQDRGKLSRSPLRPAMFPEPVVHAHEAVARNDAHRNLVRQLLRLEIRVVREHPHVAQLVGHRRIEFFIAQTLQESMLDRKPEGLASIEWRFDRHDQRDLRLDRDIHILRNPQLASKTIDDELKTLGDESGWFSRGCGSHRSERA